MNVSKMAAGFSAVYIGVIFLTASGMPIGDWPLVVLIFAAIMFTSITAVIYRAGSMLFRSAK